MNRTLPTLPGDLYKNSIKSQNCDVDAQIPTLRRKFLLYKDKTLCILNICQGRVSLKHQMKQEYQMNTQTPEIINFNVEEDRSVPVVYIEMRTLELMQEAQDFGFADIGGATIFWDEDNGFYMNYAQDEAEYHLNFDEIADEILGELVEEYCAGN